MSQISKIKEKISQISELLKYPNGIEVFDIDDDAVYVGKVIDKPLVEIDIDEYAIWLGEKATNDIINKLQELRNEIWGVK